MSPLLANHESRAVTAFLWDSVYLGIVHSMSISVRSHTLPHHLVTVSLRDDFALLF